MKKAQRIKDLVQELGVKKTDEGHDPCYLGYFSLFNEQKYYEAHDVLEHLWLKSAGPEFRFFKGLIQLAGAFVHLKKQFENPTHHVHGRRVHPAHRLFVLACLNLDPYTPSFLNFDVSSATQLAKAYIGQIEETQFRINPWTPIEAPALYPKVSAEIPTR